MTLQFKNKESFLKEIIQYQKLNNSTLLEAIADYMERYNLEESYIANNLITPGIAEKLLSECDKLNLLKKSDQLEPL